MTAAMVLASLAMAGSAQAAETIYGTTGTDLSTFSSASPGTIELTRTVTGMQPAETIAGLDVRPATGELMALGSTGRVYRLNPRTGAALERTVAPLTLTGARHAVEFNPSVDRLRVVTDAENNQRVNPVDGTLSGTDSNLAPAGNVVSLAHDRNTGGASATTLFALDSASDKLVRIGGVDGAPSPNGGIVTEVGATNFGFEPDAGFDISGSDGTAYASLKVGGTTALYTIDLASGAATKVGDLGRPVIDIAVAQPAHTFYWAVNGSALLVRGRSDVVTAVGPDVMNVAGLAAGEYFVGLDQRPATGELIGLTNQDKVYLVDPEQAVAAQIGTAPLSPAFGTVRLGFDFNPVADRIRLVGDNEKNLRLDPATGAIASTDADLSPSGDTTGAAYTNSFPGANATTLFDVDSDDDQLLRQNPDSGALTVVQNLSTTAAGTPTLDLEPLNGFDIAPAGGFGFLLSREAGSNPLLVRVNLTEGPVTGGRAVVAGSTQIASDPSALAVMSPGQFSVGAGSAGEPAGKAQVVVVRTGGDTGPATVEYATANGSALAGQDYAATSGVLRFADGERARIVEVPLIDDSAVEDAETFSLNLAKPGEGALLGAGAATVTVFSDDVAPAATQPPPPLVVRDRTRPLSFMAPLFKQTIRTVRLRGFKFKLVIGEPATATFTATIANVTAKRLKLASRRIATGRITYNLGAIRTITLRLTPQARAGFLRSRLPLAVTVTARVTDRAKNVTTTTASAALPVK